ncbi:hypothetical protein CSUI_008290, partial [Cystoisospora suis]
REEIQVSLLVDLPIFHEYVYPRFLHISISPSISLVGLGSACIDLHTSIVTSTYLCPHI